MANESEFPKSDGDVLYASEVNYQAGNFIEFVAGEDITAGQVVFIKKDDGKVYISDKSSDSTYYADGIAINSATSGNTVYVQLRGKYITSGLTANTLYYLGTAGSLSTTRSGILIGYAKSSTELFINIKEEGNVVFLGSDELTTAGTTLVVDNLDTTEFDNLYISIEAINKSGNSGTAEYGHLRFNDDTSANYWWVSPEGSSGNEPDSYIRVGKITYNNLPSRGFLAHGLITNHQSTLKQASLTTNDGIDNPGICYGVWNNTTSKITKVTFIFDSNLVAGSKMKIWGVRGRTLVNI